MRVHKMTKYDEGQVLIRASDELFECATELRDTQPELSDMLHHMGCQIGSKFNELKYPQGFGLRGLDECNCNNCQVSRSFAERVDVSKEK